MLIIRRRVHVHHHAGVVHRYLQQLGLVAVAELFQAYVRIELEDLRNQGRREGQRMAWQTLPVTVAPVLPGTLPVLDWFAAEQGFSGPTCVGAEGAATLN